MKSFMNDRFLIHNDKGYQLYKNAAEGLPILDYHCHLPAKEIWENEPFANLSDVWFTGDHYKWRAMRMYGIEERFITGDASPYEKFEAYASVMPNLLGNQLYHWSHMELKRYFGVDRELNASNAAGIWEEVQRKLEQNALAPRDVIQMENVQMIGTTDDPVDSLAYHDLLAEHESFDVSVLPTFRPDNVFKTGTAFNEWVDQLEIVTQSTISSAAALEQALLERMTFFHERGCRSSDHDIVQLVWADCTKEEDEAIFERLRSGQSISEKQQHQWFSWIMSFLARHYHEHNWVMQLHIGVLRDANQRGTAEIGKNAGFDAINELNTAEHLTHLLNDLNTDRKLPKTILYSVNSKDFDVLSTIGSSFSEEGLAGKVQLGAAWWFHDHVEGIKKQLQTAAKIGQLGAFNGMLTDSRSFLSYTRHDYFRRILCSMIGGWIENGELLDNDPQWETIIRNICFNNTNQFFDLRFEKRQDS
ncbi:glucuronate isomerase [Salibacterium qingdaonense]|uniref:Uronate isomerase n=1 Tax=Salibacterium qingdaonense TaxID=266892 RepID=A0A1I4N2X4_9BACI|nr:glucuronate isomerase [Salibacterium qingdaonense]SFM09869.1 glucuronate isomerase [Salibacterium qingdaonense]